MTFRTHVQLFLGVEADSAQKWDYGHREEMHHALLLWGWCVELLGWPCFCHTHYNSFSLCQFGGHFSLYFRHFVLFWRVLRLMPPLWTVCSLWMLSQWLVFVTVWDHLLIVLMTLILFLCLVSYLVSCPLAWCTVSDTRTL